MITIFKKIFFKLENFPKELEFCFKNKSYKILEQRNNKMTQWMCLIDYIWNT